MTEDTEKKVTATVAPGAFVTIALHAAQYGTSAVHGILLGSYGKDSSVQISKVCPVCHEPPSKTLVETALSLASALSEDEIVGWYVAPEKVNDDRPGPAALRIVAGLAAATEEPNEPVLLVVNNESLAQCLKGDTEKTQGDVLVALGKDFGQQWLEPLNTTVTDETIALEGARKGYMNDTTKVIDLVEHWESNAKQWLIPDADLAKLLS